VPLKSSPEILGPRFTVLSGGAKVYSAFVGVSVYVPATRPATVYLPSAPVVAVSTWPAPSSAVSRTPLRALPALMTVPRIVYVITVAAKSWPAMSGPTVTSSDPGANVYSALLGVSV